MTRTLEGPILNVLQPIARALETLRSGGYRLADLGELQGVISNVIRSTTPAFQPVYDAATRLLVDTRDKYVASLSTEDFLALVRKEKPGLLESQLEKDCDDDGNPLQEGKELPAAIDPERIDARARKKFAAATGFSLVKEHPVDAAAVDAIEDLAVRVALDHEDELVAAYQKTAEANLAHKAMPMRMYIPPR
jgi:hypothetical protein